MQNYPTGPHHILLRVLTIELATKPLTTTLPLVPEMHPGQDLPHLANTTRIMRGPHFLL